MHTSGIVKLKASVNNESCPTFQGSLTMQMFVEFFFFVYVIFSETVRARTMELESWIHLEE